MKLQIVIIEDEYSLRETLSMFAEELGHDVVTFDSLRDVESLEALPGCGDSGVRTLFLIDQNLPGGEGLAFISQRIQSGKCRCGGKCMAIMSGALTNKELERAKTLGCSILEKPVMFDDLKTWLDSMML